MKVLVACEFSGVVRRAFQAAGHDAWSCDLQASDDASIYHIIGDARDVVREGWDLLIAHPPCTRLTNSGVRWLAERDLWGELEEGAALFRDMLDAPVARIAVENPIPHGHAMARIGRKYDQIIQPWMFGHDASKATCLWLKGLPVLRPTKFAEPRWICCGIEVSREAGKYGCPNCNGDNGPARPRWSNQTNSGQNRLSPGRDRANQRSKTYEGIAAAMAHQWGSTSHQEAA